jgi:predicted GIY-YIG superfamily endonuclease
MQVRQMKLLSGSFLQGQGMLHIYFSMRLRLPGFQWRGCERFTNVSYPYHLIRYTEPFLSCSTKESGLSQEKEVKKEEKVQKEKLLKKPKNEAAKTLSV